MSSSELALTRNIANSSSTAEQGVAVHSLADREVVTGWKATPADERKFLVLGLRISGAVIAPYQKEVIRVNS